MTAEKAEQLKPFWEVGYRTQYELETLSILLNEFPAEVIMLAHAEVLHQNKNRRDVRRVERKLLGWTRKGWNTFDEIFANLKAERAEKPYTLEELYRLAPGFPVYTLSFGNEYGWALLDYKDGKLIAIRCLAEDGVTAEYLHEYEYGTVWTAYSKDISPGEWG